MAVVAEGDGLPGGLAARHPFFHAAVGDLTVADVAALLEAYKEVVLRYEALAGGYAALLRGGSLGGAAAAEQPAQPPPPGPVPAAPAPAGAGSGESPAAASSSAREGAGTETGVACARGGAGDSGLGSEGRRAAAAAAAAEEEGSAQPGLSPPPPAAGQLPSPVVAGPRPPQLPVGGSLI